MKYYNLPKNPSSLAGTIGKEVPKEMQFWTKEEYLKFAEEMMDKPRSYYAFELLYWTGIRSGELLALTPGDFDFEKQTLRINKTFHRSKGKDIITTPKTVKSNRIITLPPFLCDEIKDYLGMFYEIGESERMFSFTKSYLGHDVKGIAPRKLYKKFGFEEDELIEEFGYPNQRFVLHANKSADNV